MTPAQGVVYGRARVESPTQRTREANSSPGGGEVVDEGGDVAVRVNGCVNAGNASIGF
jgi:hypothetical protein